MLILKNHSKVYTNCYPTQMTNHAEKKSVRKPKRINNSMNNYNNSLLLSTAEITQYIKRRFYSYLEPLS